jgi:hypothetical protein
VQGDVAIFARIWAQGLAGTATESCAVPRFPIQTTSIGCCDFGKEEDPQRQSTSVCGRKISPGDAGQGRKNRHNVGVVFSKWFPVDEFVDRDVYAAVDLCQKILKTSVPHAFNVRYICSRVFPYGRRKAGNQVSPGKSNEEQRSLGCACS